MKLALVPCFEVCSLLSPDVSEIDVERTFRLTSYSPHYVIFLYNVVCNVIDCFHDA